MTDDMIERVADALEWTFKDLVSQVAGMPFDATGVVGPGPDFWDAHACAAIEAMREPTEAMLEAGVGTLPNDGGISSAKWEADIVWQAMIDAALDPAAPLPGRGR